MFRVVKVLNNNGVLAIKMENQTEVIMLGKGIGFGRKVNERFSDAKDAKIYELIRETERGNSFSLIQKIDPIYLEIVGEIIQYAQKELGEIDENILLPLADHIAFAVKRIENDGVIVNPMTQDIKALFSEEYSVAEHGKNLIWDKIHLVLDEDEIGYIALHIHSARDKEKLSEVMEQTQLIHSCISKIEQEMKIALDPSTTAYNRLLSHMKYMLLRMKKGEKIELDMNAYVEHQYPVTYSFSKNICEEMSQKTKLSYTKEEIGYLAIHIERVRTK